MFAHGFGLFVELVQQVPHLSLGFAGRAWFLSHFSWFSVFLSECVESLDCVWFGVFDLCLCNIGQPLFSGEVFEDHTVNSPINECIQLISVIQISHCILQACMQSQTVIVSVEATLRALAFLLFWRGFSQHSWETVTV